MLDHYLLDELVTFAAAKTLAKTAATLHVTQPTITRGMQKLETELGVTLFDRQPNRIRLTATGQLAAQEAAQLLDQERAIVLRIQNYDRSLTTRPIETTLPGPLVLLDYLADQLPTNLAVNRTLLTPSQVVAHLTDHQAALIFSNQDLQTPTIESRLIGNENLTVHLQKFMYQANQATITFDELRGLSFVVLNAIGGWRDIIQARIPDAKFLYQPQRAAFTEITKYSDFPYFSTNLTPFDASALTPDDNDNRVAIPISDAAAHMPIYVSYLTAQRGALTDLIQQFSASWPVD